MIQFSKSEILNGSIFRALVLLMFSGIFHFQGKAQIDVEFWFAPPEITCGTLGECAGTRRDGPVFVVVSTLNEPATVQLWKPADLSFTPLIFNLAANSTQQIPINRELFETKPADSVVTTGLLIRSTAPITAYYEIRSPNNTDIFTLKGKNALGTDFYLPFQNDYINKDILNGQFYNPLPKSGFVIIATDDTTTVTITPTKDVFGGHPANVPYTIFLQRGQTYYGEAIDQDPANRLIGTHITSDKPITVTVKDDMIDLNEFTDGGADIAGDQIMPVDWIGTRYVVIRGNLQNTPLNEAGDRAYVLATEDNTQIFIDGSTTPSATINRGEQFRLIMANTVYEITSDKPVYVWQISGIGDQLAGAIIPSLECTGSNQVGFVRSSSNTFIMNLIIKGGAGAENDFVLNGNPNLVQGSAFQPIPGSDYLYAQITFSSNAIPAGTTSLLQNFGTELFHMGLINRGNAQTCNFGYFTSYSYLNLGDNRQQCIGDSAVLDAGPGKTSYLWNTGEITQKITVFEEGTYYVEVTSGSECAATDTITLQFYEPPLDLGVNDTICEGTTLLLSPPGVYLFEWQDGSTNSTYLVTQPGEYSVSVTDFQGCFNRDTINIANTPKPPTPILAGGGTFCEGDPFSLTMTAAPFGQYNWIGPNFTFFTGQIIAPPSIPSSSGAYAGFYAVGSCQSDPDTINLQVNPRPEAEIGLNDTICGVTTVTLNPGLSQPDYQYLWQDGSTDSTLTINNSGIFSVTIVNSFNCSVSDTVSIFFSPLPNPVTIAGDTVICEGESFSFGFIPQAGADYAWTGPNGFVTSGSTVNIIDAQTGGSGVYTVQPSLNGCVIPPSSVTINIYENPIVSVSDTVACGQNSTVLVDAKEGFATYSWSNDAVTQTASFGPGTHFVTVTNSFGCAATDTFTVGTGGPTAQFVINPSNAAVVNTNVSFEDQSVSSGSPISSWSWTNNQNNFSNIQNPVVTYADPGVFTITLTVVDENGCADSTSQSYTVTSDLSIPNSFTPNGDGFNDFFVIKGLQAYPNSDIVIYNRWGNEVYASSSYQNNWGAENHPDGVYFFVLKLNNGETLKGDITVIRKK